MTTAQDLRRVIGEIRRRPYPIKDLIPLLDRAATELENSIPIPTHQEYLNDKNA